MTSWQSGARSCHGIAKAAGVSGRDRFAAGDLDREVIDMNRFPKSKPASLVVEFRWASPTFHRDWHIAPN
jgi:hypothetical protein